MYRNKTIERIKEAVDNNKISESKGKEYIEKINRYYEESKNLPADVSSNTIKENEPKFDLSFGQESRGSDIEISTSSIDDYEPDFDGIIDALIDIISGG